MMHFRTQLCFDGKRLVLRNLSFLFFSLLMPTGFYILFTRIMTMGNPAQMKLFFVTYMGSMIIYSGLISAVFSVAAILKHDRDHEFVDLLKATPHGLNAYYISIGLWSMAMSGLAIIVIGSVATVVNQVSLSGWQWLGMVGIALFGQIPLLMIGAMMASIQHNETLSLVSNIVTFPMAILSGLWWPLNLLPTWLQKIGKLLPTYFTNELLGNLFTSGKIKLSSFIGISVWSIGLLAVMLIVVKAKHKWGAKIIAA
ncbi:ABC transporter permease [Loigolactobacillus binensis]|uniref:ABC transporter permease n=1 Tax=Loigolactobacillus binensis TaxID=2559922 RepID=A0ABW3EAL3_9LACO|nr:ABC transporter permease [Loigolactobacillus binensis]